MKTNTNKYFLAFSILAFFITAVSMSSLAFSQNIETNSAMSGEGDFDHNTLARQYDNLAQEMLTKAEEEKAEIVSKPNTSFFGKTGMRHKARLKNKIYKYEKAAAEYLDKAGYHRKIAAGQTDGKLTAEVNQHNELINKAKKKSTSNSQSFL